MQNAKTILSILNQTSERNKQFVFDRLYRNLFNQDFFMDAYRKMYAKPGNMTKGTDGQTIDGFKKSKVDKLISMLRNEQYYPTPVRRTYIPKKNGKKRPLGIPSFEDKLVQEVIRKMLDAIYEPLFLDTSHGFRPNRSCQTALFQVKTTSRGTKWVVEGDITGCFDNVDHEILLQILSKKISDGRFLELIRRFLKAGYFEFHQVKNSLSGVPQGGIISPILSNIYLHEFDVYMEMLAEKLSKGKTKKPNPDYRKVEGRRSYCLKTKRYEEAAELLQKMREIPSKNQMDGDYARVKYVRYADDFVICIDGNKALAEQIKQDVSRFLWETLKLELNADKTLITNLKNERVKFLGYEISKSLDNTIVKKRSSDGAKLRSVNETIQLLVPSEAINRKIQPFTQDGKAASFKPRVNLPILDIINEYNSEIRGLYNYYSLATDVSVKLNKFKYYHYWSLLRTIAHKEKSTVTKVKSKYGIDVPRKVGTGTRKLVGVRYTTNKGEQTMTYFNDSLKKLDEPNTRLTDKYCPEVMTGKQLINRLNANVCELCGIEEGNFEVHHVRKLKDIKDKYKKRGKAIPRWVLIMSQIRRKTLIVCECCHHNIHSGNF